MLDDFLRLVEKRCETREAGIPYDATYKEHYLKEENEPSKYCEFRYSSRGEERFDDAESVDIMCQRFYELLISHDATPEDCYRFLIELPDYYLRCMLNKVNGFCVKPLITRMIYIVFISHWGRAMRTYLWDDYATYKLSEIISGHKTYIECIDEWYKYGEENY